MDASGSSTSYTNKSMNPASYFQTREEIKTTPLGTSMMRAINDHTHGAAGMCVPYVLFVEWAAFLDVRSGTEKRGVKAFYGRAMCGGLT